MAKIGRPAVFKGSMKKHIASLVRKHGLTGAQREFTDEVKAGKWEVPASVKLSLPTISKIAKAAGIKLMKGRRAAVKAEKAA